MSASAPPSKCTKAISSISAVCSSYNTVCIGARAPNKTPQAW